MTVMCLRADTPCVTIRSDTHTWNVVLINGNIRHLDARWDLGKYMKDWNYYRLTDEEIRDLNDGSHNFHIVQHLNTTNSIRKYLTQFVF